MGMIVQFLLLFMWLSGLQVCSCDTDPQDAAALRSLMDEWQSAPPSWGQSNDPCGTPWDGVVCNNSRVTVLGLSTMGIKGTLSGDIGQLAKLQSLDLSYNSDLGGPLTPNIGNLKELTTLDLNSNQFTGNIPASLGNLSKLYWLDLATNKLTGMLPISEGTTPGLDLLINTKHFYFNENQLSGQILEQLFSSQMTLIHILLDGNNFTGSIPRSLGLVKSLEVLRLDRNSLSGSVPSNINNLTSCNELNVANNNLTGSMPDLTGMNNLNYVDLSNNTFVPSGVPRWFSTIQSLMALVVESGGLSGQVPAELFSFPQLQQVMLKNNKFNGTLDMGSSISSRLQTVDFQNNSIASVILTSAYNNTLILVGNPVCNTQLSNTIYCRSQQQTLTPYSANLSQCGSKSCPSRIQRGRNSKFSGRGMFTMGLENLWKMYQKIKIDQDL